MSDDAVESIRAATRTFLLASANDEDAEMKSALTTMLEQVTEIEQEHPVEVDVGDFFASVAAGVVDAQAQLDRLSDEYRRSLERDGHSHALPVRYTVTRTRAQTSFELSTVDSKRVGVLFRRSRQQTRTSIEHGISFEIQAVPPPPEARIRAGTPFELVFDDDEELRERIAAALEHELDQPLNTTANAAARGKKLYAALEVIHQGAPLVRRPGGHVLLVMVLPRKWTKPLELPEELVMIAVDDSPDGLRVRVSDQDEEQVPPSLKRFLAEALNEALGPPRRVKKERNQKARDVSRRAKEAKEREFDSKSVEALVEAAAALEQLFPDVPDPSPLSRFFVSVARSLDEAQRDLDRRSAKYLDQGPLQPTTFRIPSVSADISLAVESARGRKLNAIVYSREHREQRRHEQRVHFDIEAAPLRPEQLMTPPVSARAKRMTYAIVTDPAERERIREAFEGSANAKIRRLADVERFARLFILRSRLRYTVFEASQDGQTWSIAAVYLDRELAGGPRMEGASRLPESYRWLFDWWLSPADG